MAEEGVFHSEPTKEALELMPTGLFLLTAAHDGEDNWQFVQRGLGITSGPPTILVVVLSPRNKTTELWTLQASSGWPYARPVTQTLSIAVGG